MDNGNYKIDTEKRIATLEANYSSLKEDIDKLNERVSWVIRIFVANFFVWVGILLTLLKIAFL